MGPELVVVLLLFVLLAAWSFYGGWVSRDRSPFRWIANGSFILIVLFPIPVCFLVLLDQSQATARLAGQGVVPHPSIKNAVGVATGKSRGPMGLLLKRARLHDPMWVFQVNASPAEICAFYREGANAPGWTLVGDGSPMMLVLKRGSQTLAISPQQNLDGSRGVVYMITERARSGPVAE